MHQLEMSVKECANTTAPIELSITSASISALLLLVTIPANFLVCLAIIIDPNRELKTQFNCFTFNLALADLIVGCITEPMSIYAHVTEALASNRDQKVSPVVLKMFHVPYFISAMASVLTITALACERYLAINAPLRYRKYFNIKLTLVCSACIWIIAICFGMLNLIFDYIFESFIFINSGVLFTGAVVCFAWYSVHLSLQKAANQWKKNGLQRERDIITQLKLTKTFGLMVGVLLLCYIPASSMVYFINLCTHCYCDLIQWFRDAAFWLVLLNSALDPYVYAIRTSIFQNAISKIIKCKYWQRKKYEKVPFIKRSKVGRHNIGAVNTMYGSLDTNTDDNSTNQN